MPPNLQRITSLEQPLSIQQNLIATDTESENSEASQQENYLNAFVKPDYSKLPMPEVRFELNIWWLGFSESMRESNITYNHISFRRQKMVLNSFSEGNASAACC